MKDRALHLFRRLSSTEFMDKLERDKIFDLAASLSYFTALSLAPLLLLTLTSVSLLGDSFKEDLAYQVQTLIGGRIGETINSIAAGTKQNLEFSGWAGIVGILTLLISAGAIFGQLRSSLNTIFEVPPELIYRREPSIFSSSLDFIERKLFNLGMVFTFVFVSLISLVVSSVMSMVLHGFEAVLGQAVNFIFSIVVFALLFGSIYYFLPQKRIRKRIALFAGIFTAILFTIGKTLLGLYLGQSAIASLYGAAGSLIILLMWVYYSSIIIFISAEIANELDKRKV